MSALASQIVVAAVYSTLIAIFLYAFRAPQRPPLHLKLTSAKDLGFAVIAWLGAFSIALAVYFLLSPLTGGIAVSARQILTVATDVKRLQGQSGSAWSVALVRGCLIVPVFEELLFRELILSWLRKRLSDRIAVAISAALFAGMHVYPVVLPYTFVFGLFTGSVRIRTGSTLNTIAMHVLNNVVFLFAGLSLLR